MILAEFTPSARDILRAPSLNQRRLAQLLPVPADIETVALEARRSPDPEKRLLAGELLRLLALQEIERRNLEELRASSAQFRAIVENLLTALVTIDEEGRIQGLNPAAERMYGYTRAELKGRSVTLLMATDSHEKALSMLRRTLSERKGQSVEGQARRKNGQLFPVELMLFETSGPHGRLFTGNVRDLTDRKAAQRLQTDLVSIVSHELRTPLASIRGSLTLIGTGIFGEVPAEAAELVAIAERNCNRLIDLVSDLLDLERFENSEMPLEMEATALREVIQRGIEGVKGFAAQQGVTIEVGETGGSVWANGSRLVQVVVNLLSNAIKFSPPGAPVRILTVERRGSCEVRVEDKGRGIPRQFLHSIFERFGQVETSDSRVKGGTGLGLAICKSIVAKHLGQIGVESEEGLGSTFFFWIPKKSPLHPLGENEPLSEPSTHRVITQ
jgi:PAS domain S-box-containing protein